MKCQSFPLLALQPDGTRGTVPENPRTKKLCEGEPAVWDLLSGSKLRESLDGKTAAGDEME